MKYCKYKWIFDSSKKYLSLWLFGFWFDFFSISWSICDILRMMCLGLNTQNIQTTFYPHFNVYSIMIFIIMIFIIFEKIQNSVLISVCRRHVTLYLQNVSFYSVKLGRRPLDETENHLNSALVGLETCGTLL